MGNPPVHIFGIVQTRNVWSFVQIAQSFEQDQFETLSALAS